MTPIRKPADTTLPLLEAIRERWSPRAISDQVVEQEKIDTIFEAARWAPSSSNMQPWRYLYATKDDGDDRMKLESLLNDGNSWAKNAYILIIAFFDPTRVKSDGTITDNPFALHDTGAASFSIVLQASALGLVAHQMAGFDSAHANEKLGVPPPFIPASMMAVGYPADESILSEELRKREQAPRIRKLRNEFVMREHWGNS